MSEPFDPSRSLTALEQDSTVIAVIQMSQSKWLVAAVIPGVERQPLKRLDADEEALLTLLHRWRNEANRAGREIKRIVVAYEAGRDGFWLAQLIRELAVRHVISWTSVELEGGPAPPTPENIAAVMELYPLGERFFQEFKLRQVLLNAAKNGCGPSAAGTSNRAEGPTTAEPAAMTTCPAPEANLEPTGGSALTGSTP
jgi:hypothetical protein